MNGTEARNSVQNARQMTEEIDRATNLEAEKQIAQKEAWRTGSQELDRTQAGNFGSRVLTYNPDSTAAQNAERVREIADIDAGYGRMAARETSLTGMETAVESKEWLAEDREDIDNELGLNGKYVKNIMDRNQKSLTKETVETVDRIIAKNNYHPSQLDEVANRLRTNFLKDVFNRILGSRN